jgi:soluble lytic murein transglycosylase
MATSVGLEITMGERLMKRLLVLLLALFVASSTHAASWPTGLEPVLSTADKKAYQRLFDQARAGKKPDMSQVSDKLLKGHLLAELYGNSPYKTSYAELKDWLETYSEYPQAVNLYQVALKKMPTPKKVCKGKGKNRKCETTGKRAEPPLKPLATRKREQAQQAAARLRDSEYDGMNPVKAEARRKALGTAWKLRSAGKHEQALNHLDNAEVRGLLGDPRWQAELVWIADAQLSKQNWGLMYRAGRLAGQAQGPERDDALWWAGFAAFRRGEPETALKAWKQIVENEPATAPHTARAAFWAARVLNEKGQSRQATEMLQAAARDKTSFYGQLAAGRLGQKLDYNWSAPTMLVNDLAPLKNVKSARRALALAQVDEIALAQQEFRVANEDIPSQATRSLAALALQLHLPATALQMGRTLLEEGDVPHAALYPLAEDWKPRGPLLVERPLLLAIMRQESAFHPRIGSHAGAQGLMQLMPATAKYIVGKTGRGQSDRGSLHNPGNNMTLGHDYLHYLQGKTDGNLVATIAAYNGGLGNVNKWLNRPIANPTDPLLFIESIPFDETRHYVQKVMSNLWIYENRLGQHGGSLTQLAHNRWPIRQYASLAE